jgi:predicted Zn-dependent protease with MMP-like domain
VKPSNANGTRLPTTCIANNDILSIVNTERTISDEAFDQLVTHAMNELPQEYIKGLDNVAIVYADWPDQHQAAKSELKPGSLLLGLYEGIPLTQRGSGYTYVLPDKITLFKTPMLMITHSEAELAEQIKRTLWHEIAHYYGLNHSRIDALEGFDHQTGHHNH